MNIFKKICISGLCINLALSSYAYAGVLDSITDSQPRQEEQTEKPKNEIQTDATEAEEPENKGTENISDIDSKSISLSDIKDHWAESWIKNAVDMGFVNGYKDGTFKPDRTVTRAEFATLLNNAVKNTDKVNLKLTDINSEDWYYKEIQKAVAVGFFNGYKDDTFKPNKPITREEAAKVVCSAITTGGLDSDIASLLKDYNNIQDWAKPSVNSVYDKGYLIGYPEGTYKPTKPLSRAEAVKIIYEVIDNENIERGFNLTNHDETYSGAVVVGNLNVLDSVGSGSVYINNVTVLGDLIIKATNIKSVELTDVKARTIIVEDSKNQVKIICNDNIYLQQVQMPAIASLESPGTNINIKDTVIR